MDAASLIVTIHNNGWARVCLNRPKTLHALTTDLCLELKQQLAVLASDSTIHAIWLESSTDKAFSAGGDVRTLHQHMQTHAVDEVERFFNTEYNLDLYMHNYPKPIVAWGDGYIMGGGMGLFMASAFRLVTPRSYLAMPEINIGLFPDVGASRFLAQCGQVGLFLGLTGAKVGAADAHAIGWASHVVEAGRDEVFALLQGIDWADSAAGNYSALAHALDNLHKLQVAGELQQHLDLIHSVCVGQDFGADYHAIIALQSAKNLWLKDSALNLAHGSPSTAAIAWLLWQWAKVERPWSDVFTLELAVATWKVQHGDFVEGVRARLIDKDMSPKWQCTKVDSLATALGNIDALQSIATPGWQDVLRRYVPV